MTNNKNSFLHTTYLVGGRIKNTEQLDQTRFEQFGFIYVMAAPPWKAEDFNKPEDDVMNMLVKDYSYPTADSGLGLVPELISRAHQKNVKVLLSIPGSEQFNPIAGDNRKRAMFARVMAAFVKKYDYDGIEIDWEHTVDMRQHTALMADLREALNSLKKDDKSSRKYYLTTALHSWRKYSSEEAKEVCRYVDWVNVMTYDIGGGIWGKVATHNTPLDKISKTLRERWSEFPRDRICIGLASYGFYYKGIAPGEKSEVSLKEKGRYCSYTELPSLLEKGWQESYDTKADAPYYFSPDKSEFITIENTRSISKKMEWVFEQQYLGVFWWEFHSDYFPPSEKEKYASHTLADHVTSLINEHEKPSRPITPGSNPKNNPEKGN